MAKGGREFARERTNALRALHNAGLLKFVSSVDRPRGEEFGRGGRLFTVEMNGERVELDTTEVDAFVKGVVLAAKRTDIDLTQPFAAA